LPSFIIFLAAAVAATVGPWVDAPAILSTLSGCIAIVIAWISITTLRQELREAQTAKPPVPPEVAPAQNADSSMLQSRLQVESMRTQALESELRDTKKKYDELLRERIELLRRIGPTEAVHSKSGSPYQAAGNREAAQSIRQRDLWIQAQQVSLGEFKSGLNQVTNSLQRCLTLFNSISLDSLNEGATGSKTGIQLKALLRRCADALQMETIEAEIPSNMANIKIPDSIDRIFAGFLSLRNRLEEIADHARVAAMNARLLKDRPAEPDALNRLDQEMENVSAGLQDLVKFSGPFAPDLEKMRLQVADNANAFAGLNGDLNYRKSNLEKQMSRLSVELLEDQNRLEEIMKADADSEEKRRDELERIEVAVQDTTKSLTNACTIAHSLDLTIERMVQVSKIATGRSEALKTPLETSATD